MREKKNCWQNRVQPLTPPQLQFGPISDGSEGGRPRGQPVLRDVPLAFDAFLFISLIWFWNLCFSPRIGSPPLRGEISFSPQKIFQKWRILLTSTLIISTTSGPIKVLIKHIFLPTCWRREKYGWIKAHIFSSENKNFNCWQRGGLDP